MHVEITLKNYRCFQDVKPVRFCIRDGFISFVGVNNSGKSTLLKFFYEFRNLFRLLSSPSGNILSALMDKEVSTAGNYGASFKDRNEILCNFNNRDLEAEFDFRGRQFDAESDELWLPNKVILKICRSDHSYSLTLHKNEQVIDTRTKNLQFTAQTKLTGINAVPPLELSPLFDGFRCLSETFYIGPFRNAINGQTSQPYFDIFVGQNFLNGWNAHKTGAVKKENDATKRVTNDIKRIFDFSDLDINSAYDYTDMKVYINNMSYGLLELGSGLAQCIIILGNVAIHQPSFILIDEPELNLHPRLQLDFLTSLAAYAKNGVMFATHSIGLARAISEEIYSIRIGEQEVREVTEFERLGSLSEFLGELGFSGYRDLGFDKLLLVEGPHDLVAVQQFLRKFRKDHEIVILSLGGGSMFSVSELQLQEIKRITNKVFALIDSERESATTPLGRDRANFEVACKKLDIECCVLKRRAIENYLSDRAIKEIKGTNYSALQPYEVLKNATLGWGKAENWRIAREMTKGEIENTDLGEFLKKI